ncbi:MAG: helix-turn-helix domain-containing protein [Actinomycetota bacterium]|uniref:helix-turn-helix domain-containing protein n=1 Tax=Euzebya pacifica TaxID=1608957 RepID=UPI0030FBB42D
MSTTETTTDPDTLLSIREVADRLSISTATVHRLIQVRDLDHLRLGRRTIRIPESALSDYLTRCTVRRLR